MEVSVLKFDHFGRGIAKVNDKVIFIDKALPKEIVDITITNEKKNYCEGKINRIIQGSDKRIKPICPYFDKCGGCTFLHIMEEQEKDYKLEKGKEFLGKINNFYETKKLNYRNKVTLHVKNNKLGFYKEKSNEIVEIDYCYLLEENINKVIKDLKNIDLSKYHIKRIIIKSNKDTILLDIDAIIDSDFLKYFDYVDTIISNNEVVKGLGFIEEIIDGKVFKITSNSFFQVNKDGLLNINKIIKEFLKDKHIKNALDLYSGTSLWGILISDYVGNVTGIEINKESYLNAKDNIKKNNINNIKVINGDVANYIDNFENIDLVIVDPPRSGLDKKTRYYLKQINSAFVIYISCDMSTLKRDLEELKELYEIIETNLVDMFKRTYHVECVCLLCRKTVDK